MCFRLLHRKTVHKKGVTLLEVLISISIVCTCMISFAAVYPASFRLTRKTSLSNQACAYAKAVSEELGSLRVCRPSSSYKKDTGEFLEDFCGNQDDYSAKVPLKKGRMENTLHFPSVALKEPFSLVAPSASGAAPDNNSPTGIVVNSGNTNKNFWNISVTVYWTETDPKGKLQHRSSTIVSSKSVNVIKN